MCPLPILNYNEDSKKKKDDDREGFKSRVSSDKCQCRDVNVKADLNKYL